MAGSAPAAPRVVVSVEHASHRVPAHLGHLGLPARYLKTHHGWDPGAALVGRLLARGLGARLHLGRWSRLVADLNRSSFHPAVLPRTTGGRVIERNHDLTPKQRRERIQRYWLPYRQALSADLDRAVQRHGKVLHISVHSFVERLDGEERRNHVGLLYRPSRRRERAMADRLHQRLQGAGYGARRNYPYSGLDDGCCMRTRAERSGSTYVGMEVEMNQAWVRSNAGARRFAAVLIEAFAAERAYFRS